MKEMRDRLCFSPFTLSIKAQHFWRYLTMPNKGKWSISLISVILAGIFVFTACSPSSSAQPTIAAPAATLEQKAAATLPPARHRNNSSHKHHNSDRYSCAPTYFNPAADCNSTIGISTGWHFRLVPSGKYTYLSRRRPAKSAACRSARQDRTTMRSRSATCLSAYAISCITLTNLPRRV